VTGTPGDGALYPALAPGGSGLTKMSFALIDHLRSVDKRRVRRVFGQLAPNELGSVDDGLALFLGFGDRLEPASTPRIQ
jgi:mRNA-degrading endonuclease toxin of MazEF toxin-antitoxin module